MSILEISCEVVKKVNAHVEQVYHLIMVILAQISQIIPIQIDRNWDSEDPACYNDHNEHAIFTFHLYVNYSYSTDDLRNLFLLLLEKYRAVSGINLHHYGLERYSGTAPEAGQNSVYLSVYL